MDRPSPPPPTQTDLSNCENEPIRYLAAIQPHGALLVLGRSSKIIEAASESCQTWLGLSASHLLGRTLGQVFGTEFEAGVLACFLDDLSPLIPMPCDGRPLVARSFCNDTGQIVVDIEPCSQHDAHDLPNFSHRCRLGVQNLRRFATESVFTLAATGLIRRLTGFDQVMIYRFDEDWNGEVVAESIAPHVESYLGLHFPASDFPAQARELFKLCRLRLIPDVNDTPSALLATTDPHDIDLGRSSLRSVSTICIEYLRNMGARATLVGALVVDGRLWGLVSCQNKNEPKYVTPADREALTWLCEDIATQIEIRLMRERSERLHSLDGRRHRLIASTRQFDFRHLMQANNADLLGVVDADGFALVDDRVILTTGCTPDQIRIRELYRRYRDRHPSLPLLATHALMRDFEMEDAGDGVAGALFVPVLRQQLVTLIWFRRERHVSIKWSGNPQQPHRVDANGRLSPRQSFALFLQNERGQSIAWSKDAQNSAQELGALVEINALHQSEALSLTILNSIPERIAVLDAEGVIIVVNDAWQRFAMDDPAPNLAMLQAGVHYQDINAAVLGHPHVDAAQTAWAGIAAVLNLQSASFLYDYPYDSQDEQRWFRMSVYPVQAPARGAVVVHRSILERKRAEQALARSELHLKEAQQIASLGSWDLDVSNDGMIWSDQQYRNFGYPPGTDRHCYELFCQALHPDDRSRVLGAIERAKNAQAPYNIEFRVVHPDLNIRYLHSLGRLERDPAGQLLRITGTTLDITQRVHTQQQLESLVREQKTLLNIPSVGIAKVQNRKILWANPAFGSMLGYEPGELIGVETRWGYVSEEAWRAFGAAAYPMPPPGEVFRMEIEYVRKDQRTIWVDLSGTMLDVDSDISLWCCVDITAKKRTMDLLYESEMRFQSMANSVTILIWIADTDKLCNWFNKGWLDFTGRSLEQEVGNGWAEGVHPDDLDRCLDIYATSFDDRQEFGMEYRLRRFDGQYRWLLDHGVPRFDGQGNFLGYIGTCVDISESKQITHELQISQQRLSIAQETAHAGIYEVDFLTGNSFVTPEFERIFGFESGALAEDVQARCAHPDDLARMRAEIAAAIERHEPYEVEFRYRRLGSSEIRWAVNRGSALYDASGKPIKRTGINTDITNRKHMDAERNRLQKIVQESPEYIAITDMQARLIYLNKAGARIVGLPEDVDLSTLEIMNMHPPWATRRAMEEAIPIAIREGLWQGENTLLHRDGHEIPVSQLLLVHRDEQGRPEYLSTIMRDISRQKAYEIEIIQAKDAADAANAAKSRFLATMSHEIRTPMNGILGMAQLLLMTNANNDKRDDYARTILSSGHALLALLNDILDLSKIESGKVQFESVVFDPALLIHDTHALFMGTAQVRSLQLKGQWNGPRDQRYLADVHRLHQMLSNLVGNAIKFTRQGSVCIEGTELLREDGDVDGNIALLEFSVTDTGIGIPPDKIDLLFKPFSQTDSSTTREFGGTGLGLSIVCQLARMMGGDVGVDSVAGQGSRFWFRLRANCVKAPKICRSKSPASANASSVTHGNDPCTDPGTGKPTATTDVAIQVLAADDDPGNCMLLESFFSWLGVDLTLVHNGKQAVEAATQSIRPDVILMDLHMPIMDGYEATLQIRQWEATHHQSRLPIIALTADAYAEDRQHCTAVGMDDFLPKPIVLADLKAVLIQWQSVRRSLISDVLPGIRAARALDQSLFVAQVRAVLPLLAHHMFDALARFKALQALTADTHIAAEMIEIGLLLDAFRFDLAQERLKALAAVGDRAELMPALSQPKILMIDDAPVNMLTLGAALAGEYALQIASSGAEGLTLAIESPPHLILLDKVMPEMDGFETCRLIKLHPALKNIPIVFVTAAHDSASEVMGLSLGAADYITKPINVEIARQRIRNLLEHERLRLQVEQQQDQLTTEVERRRQSEDTLRKLSVAVE